MEKVFENLDKISDLSLRLDIFKEMIEGLDFKFKRIIVNKYIQHEKNKITKYLADKNRFLNLYDMENVQLCKTKLKKANRYVQFLKNHSIYEEKDEKVDNAVNSVGTSFSIPLERIEEFDHFCGTNIATTIKEVGDKEFSLSVLEDMKRKCLDSQELLRSKYKKARKDKDNDLLHQVAANRYIKSLLLNFINRSISTCNYQLKQNGKCEEMYEDVFGKESVLTKNQIDIVDAIINSKEVNIKSTTDLVVALKKVIKNYPFAEVYESIYKVLDIISSIEMASDLRKIYYLSLLDTLKYTKKHQYSNEKLSSSEKQEKFKLVELIKKIENNILILDKAFFNEEEFYNYQVMEYCINHIVPYYYLKEILESKPSLTLLEKDGKALIISVLEKYIESQKIELRNQKRDYIPKEYYKNFYELLLSLRKEPLSLKLQEEINQLSMEFELYLKDSGYRSENKNEALLLFKQLLDPIKNKVYSDITVCDISENLKEYTTYLINSKNRVLFEDDYFAELRGRISNYQDEFFKQYEVYPTAEVVCQKLGIAMYDYMNALYNCSTVSFLDNHIAYSLLSDGKGSSYLRMHVFDLSAYVHEGDLLDKYLMEHIDTKFRNRLLYKEGIRIPSITYQIKLFPNGTIGDLKIYPSVVNAEKHYTSLEDYRSDSILKSFVAVYKKFGLANVDNLFQLETNLIEFFINEVICFSNRFSIPIILNGKKYPDEDMLMYIQSDLGPLFSKMDKSQFQFYSNILREAIDGEHYTNDNFDKGDYNLKLSSASSYIDVFNQRMLLAYEKIRKSKDFQQACRELSDSVVHDANECIGYVEENYKKHIKIKK